MITFTEEAKARYIAALRSTCNKTRAAMAAGISTSTVAKHRKEDALFDERCNEALDEGIDLLEDSAHVRAFEGIIETRYGKDGQIVSEDRKYSDALTMFLLKAHRPDKYRERSQVDSNVSGGFHLSVDTGVPAPLPVPIDDLL